MGELPHELIREFMVAVVEDRPKAELLLAEHPNLLNARWMHNETALHYLAIEDLGDAVNFLLAHGADVNTVNEFGDSPLVDVANLGNNEVAELLIAAGADPNGPKTALQGSPLHHAARKGNVALVLPLLDAGANPAVRHRLSRDPLRCAGGGASRRRTTYPVSAGRTRYGRA
jgi:ankyrin repeat protein